MPLLPQRSVSESPVDADKVDSAGTDSVGLP